MQPWAEPSDEEEEEEDAAAAIDSKAPPVNQVWAYGATADDAAGGLYQTGLEMVQRPVDVTYSNGSALEQEQRR